MGIISPSSKVFNPNRIKSANSDLYFVGAVLHRDPGNAKPQLGSRKNQSRCKTAPTSTELKRLKRAGNTRLPANNRILLVNSRR
jgi:hypothetical protein